MSLIDNLLRAHRRRCEEGRRYLAELEDLAQRLRADAARLRAAVEAGAAGGDRSAHPATLRHAKIVRSIAAIETQIGVAAAALAAAEVELQRHELIAQRDGAAEPGDPRRGRRGRRPRPAALRG